MIDPHPYQPDDFDTETLSDFIDSLKDEIDIISGQLLVLEKDPGNRDIINALFRSVHSIKGNARMCFLEPFSDFLHAVEEMLSEVRASRMAYSAVMGEAVMLSLDQVKLKAEDLLRDGHTDIGLFSAIIPFLGDVISASAGDARKLLYQIIRILGGTVVEDLEIEAAQRDKPNRLAQQLDFEQPSEDLGFFQTMARQIDTKAPFWDKRSELQVKIALGLNRHLATPVDNAQLTVAIYLHDLGMVFLHESLINCNRKYNPMEERRVREHVTWSYEWISRIPGWSDAAQMILQHHERPDGSGYPHGLRGDDICDGAQIIAIADTFFSITNERSDRTYKKSLLRAITEINSCRDLQFKSNIVDAFNDLIRQMYRKSE